MKTPVIYHIPHSSRLIPEEYRADYLTDLETELLCMTDAFTDELFKLPGERLLFPVSRLLCDVERFRDDAMEEMSKIGMGAVYTVCHDLRPLRVLSTEKRESILRKYYDPHHDRLNRLAEEHLKKFGSCLIVDCHSFSPKPLPYEPEQNSRRPDICIGTDSFHTPKALAEAFGKAFSDLGCSVEFNSPYAGTMVPSAYYRREPKVLSVMIEINRGLYMNPDGRKNDGFERTKQIISTAIETVLGKRSESKGTEFFDYAEAENRKEN